MRLTVGPHPAAVYWRRRAVVLVALAIVVLVISYACGATDSSNADAQPSASATATPTTTLLHPTSQSPKPSASSTPTAFSLPTAPAAGGPCTDAEMSVAVKATPADTHRGDPVDFTITFKNTSSRTCSRDIGADVQEIRLLEGTAIVWSSDDCNPNTGHDVRSFAPGKDVSFTRTWSGLRSRSGTGAKVCGSSTDGLPAVGSYQLVGRLDQKLSDPFPLQIDA